MEDGAWRVLSSAGACARPPIAVPRMPQLLTLMHVFPTFAVGGAQMRFATLANALGAGLEHVVVSLDGGGGAEHLVRPDVRLRRRPVRARKRRGLSLRDLRTFRSALRAERPDLLLTYNWGAIEWALADRLSPDLPASARRRWLWPRGSAQAIAAPGLAAPPRPVRSDDRRRAVAGVATPGRRDLEARPGRVRHIPNGVDAAALAA